jgi:Na+/H+-dicarboxylate symporter
MTMTFPDLITTTTISRFRIPSYHALALALIFILILLYMVVSFPTLSRCVLSKFPRKFKSDIDSCFCTITSTSKCNYIHFPIFPAYRSSALIKRPSLH